MLSDSYSSYEFSRVLKIAINMTNHNKFGSQVIFSTSERNPSRTQIRVSTRLCSNLESYADTGYMVENCSNVQISALRRCVVGQSPNYTRIWPIRRSSSKATATCKFRKFDHWRSGKPEIWVEWVYLFILVLKIWRGILNSQCLTKPYTALGCLIISAEGTIRPPIKKSRMHSAMHVGCLTRSDF